MTTGLKFLTNPTSVFLQEGLNFHKLVESKVKSTKTCSLNHVHCRGLHTELVKGKGHTDNRKVNLPRTSEDTTMNCLKQKTSARKDSIESLFEKSRFSLEKIMGNSCTPNTKVQSGDINKESDMSENETHRKKRIGLSSAKQNKSYIYSSANKTNVRLTKVSNSARKQVRDHDEGYLDSDYPNPQKKLVTNSDEHISRLHMSVSSQSIYTFCPINSDSKLEEVSTQHSPAKSSPSDYNFIKPNYSIHFPKVQDYELKSLYINESSRKSGSTASSIRTPSDSVKNWTVNGELNSDLFDFSYSQMSHPTRANSFELFDAESMSYGCDDSLCFAPVRNLGPSLFECIQSDEEELECEESFDPTFLNSSENKPKDAEFSDIHFENEGVSFFSPAKNTEAVQSQVSSGLDENHFDFLEALRVNQADYNVDPEHISSMQSEVNEGMRAILIDWMIEVCADFKLKRDTLYIAVAFLNKYLSSVPEVPGWKLQLAGVTSLLLAAKNEEVHVPRVEDFARSTDDGYTSEQIREMELEMCKALKWRLNPITLYTLANYMMQCWDKYMDTFFQSESHKFGLEQSEMYFKQSNIKSCIKFREVTQILDLLLLNAQTLKYDMTALVVSVLYFVMGQASQKVTRDSIINCNCSFEQFMNSEVREFNTIFTIFLKEHLFPAFDGLKPVFEYVSPYFRVSFCFEAPNTIKENSKIEYKGHYEDFLSCQTHSPSNLSFVKGMMEGELSNKVEH